MDKKVTLQLFKGFLQNHGIEDEYLSEVKYHTNLDNLEDIQQYLEDDEQPPWAFIAYGFDWTKSNKGPEYWREMSSKFRCLYEDMDKKIIGGPILHDFNIKISEYVIYALMDHLEDMVTDWEDEPQYIEWVSARDNWKKLIIAMESDGRI